MQSLDRVIQPAAVRLPGAPLGTRLHPDARILIVDDEPTGVRLMEHVLQAGGYSSIRSVTDPREVVTAFHELQPDIVLLDMHMPHLDGFGVMEQLRAAMPDSASTVPILALTGDTASETRLRALRLGAKDFMTRPAGPTEILLRIANLLETRFLQLELQHHNVHLEQRLAERSRESGAAQLEIIMRLALAAEYRDDGTGEHTQRVAQVAAAVATELGLPSREVELIRLAAPMHDVGKIGVPDQILLKPGPLTASERRVMQSHATIGARILSGSRFRILQMAEAIALTHHERWDGQGYVGGVSGEDIPLAARIVAVADVLDALTHARPYKPAWSEDEALDAITSQRGSQFDPRVVDALVQVLRDGAAAEAAGETGGQLGTPWWESLQRALPFAEEVTAPPAPDLSASTLTR